MQQNGAVHLNVVHMLIEARGIFQCTWINQKIFFSTQNAVEFALAGELYC